MGRIFGSLIVLLCSIILLAATAQAKTAKEVYLKDGGIIECQKVWQANGKVMVLVNRDTLVDFSSDEVDLRKTFAKKPVKGVKKGKVRKKAATKPGAAAVQPPASPLPVAATAQKSGTAPAAKPSPQNLKPASPGSPQTATPAAKPAPSAAKPASPAIKPAQPASPPATAPSASRRRKRRTSRHC